MILRMRTRFHLCTLTLGLALTMVLTGASWGQGRQRIDSWKFLSEKYDKDDDNKISKEEYTRSEETFAQLDANKDGFLSKDDWSGNNGRGRRGGGQRGGGSAPEKGAKAPDFKLTHIRSADKTVKLSSFAGEKPVALIFGSCT